MPIRRASTRSRAMSISARARGGSGP
jgi:hypothetical protein